MLYITGKIKPVNDAEILFKNLVVSEAKKSTVPVSDYEATGVIPLDTSGQGYVCFDSDVRSSTDSNAVIRFAKSTPSTSKTVLEVHNDFICDEGLTVDELNTDADIDITTVSVNPQNPSKKKLGNLVVGDIDTNGHSIDIIADYGNVTVTGDISTNSNVKLHYLTLDGNYDVNKNIAKMPKANLSKIVIERTLKLITVTIHSAKPGLIIGKGGQEVDKLKEE
ncbi:MAG: KH domain-containing protein, partial [Pseudobutyrivibrio sp.]|nr:KH domain-containing protein [Pseudobutyrivibrio sp.]